MCALVLPLGTAEQKLDLTADWELSTRKSCGLHQGTGARGGPRVRSEAVGLRQLNGQGLPRD